MYAFFVCRNDPWSCSACPPSAFVGSRRDSERSFGDNCSHASLCCLQNNAMSAASFNVDFIYAWPGRPFIFFMKIFRPLKLQLFLTTPFHSCQSFRLISLLLVGIPSKKALCRSKIVVEVNWLTI